MADQDDKTPQETPSTTSATPVGQFVGLWNKLGVRQKVVGIVAIVALIAGLSWMSMREAPMQGEILFANLSQEDAGRLVQELQTRNVPYELVAGGTAIEVPKDQVHELRLTLAADGASPSGGTGVGFELFDRQSFGATNFVEQTNFRRALEGELARTISSLASVERARVHIATGKRSLYARKDDPPTASIVVSLKPGTTLDPAQRRGIVNLVSSSVDGLTAENVALVDGNGNALSTPGSDMEEAEVAMELERTLAARVEAMIEPVVGPGNVKVTVTADVDRAQVERTERKYDQGPDNIALASEERHVSGGNAVGNNGGVAGARGNLPGAEGAGGGGGGAGAGGQNLHEIKNYEVNQVIERTVGPRQRVRRLHVAVLLNEEVDEEGAPVTRTPEQLKSLEALARKAAGLDDQRGDGIELLSVPFVKPDLEAGVEVAPADVTGAELPPVWMMAAAAGAALLIIIVFAFIMMRRRKKKRQAAEAEAEAQAQELEAGTLPKTVEELEAELPGDAAGDERSLEKKPRLEDLDEDASNLERATAMAAADPEIAARVLRGWLTSTKRGAKPTIPAANSKDYSEAA
ncbi:MAG: flagellar basal-body MS-ring/collar protein FliF [Nannocystaceae bacterium]|nr:flagellar basal-body MS-ring/collar protein FliF [bacterium]